MQMIKGVLKYLWVLDVGGDLIDLSVLVTVAGCAALAISHVNCS